MDFKVALLYLMCVLYACTAAVVYIRGNKRIGLSFIWFAISLTLWSFGTAKFISAGNQTSATWWGNFLYFAGSLVSSSFLLFSYVFGDPKFRYKSLPFLLIISASLIVAIMAVSDQLVVNVRLEGDNKYLTYGPARIFWEVHFNGFLILAFYRFIRMYRSAKGLYRKQLLYIVVSYLTINIFAGFTNVYLLWFGITSYVWLGPPLTMIWLFIFCYAILKYGIMDTRLAITRVGLFLAVYALALGFPFYLYSIGQHAYALWFSIVLASTAPFIYSRVEKQVEDKIFRSERSYQDILLNCANTLTNKKTLPEIAATITEVLRKAVAVECAGLYVYDGGKYRLNGGIGELPLEIEEHGQLSPLIVLSIVRNNKSLGLICLGDKLSGEPYSDRDLAVFKVVADQVALAIENALYVENLERTQEQLVESEKMATIGFLVGGLAHQLKNRLTPLVFNSEFAARKIDAHRNNVIADAACDETIGYLRKILDGVESSKEVINGILNYASDRETKTDVDLKKLVAASIELIQFKIKPDTVVFENNIDHNSPPVKGNFAQLQEVLFNIIDNAHHSMMEKKAANGDPSYQPKITFEAKPSDDGVTLIITDNGMGVKEEHMRKLFTPLFSTKSKTKQGHGLGLYVMKQIIEKNHDGHIDFSSQYGQGVRIKIYLPL